MATQKIAPLSQAKAFPLPHRDDFDHLAVGQEADFFQDQAGVWEGVPAPFPCRCHVEGRDKPKCAIRRDGDAPDGAAAAGVLGR